MKKAQIVLSAIACLAFYAGAILFFVDGNNTAGILGTLAGTLFLAALLLSLRKEKRRR